MKRFCELLWVLGMVLLCTHAQASIEKGHQEQELLFGIGCTDYDEHRRDGKSTDYLVQFGAGYFVTENISTGIRLGGQFIDDGFYPECAFNIGPYFKLNLFTESKLIPYMGGQASYWNQKSTYPRPHGGDRNQGVMFGPILGLRYYINQGTFLLAEYQYRMFGCDVGDIANGAQAGFIGFGFTY